MKTTILPALSVTTAGVAPALRVTTAGGGAPEAGGFSRGLPCRAISTAWGVIWNSINFPATVREKTRRRVPSKKPLGEASSSVGSRETSNSTSAPGLENASSLAIENRSKMRGSVPNGKNGTSVVNGVSLLKALSGTSLFPPDDTAKSINSILGTGVGEFAGND